MITIIADTQHIAKRYARIVGASDEDTRHYVGNNYAVTWLEGIDLGFSPELIQALDRLSPTELPYFPERYPVVLLPADGHLKPSEKMANHARILSELIANSTYVYVATSDLQETLLKAGPMLVTVPKGFLFQLHLRSLSAKGIRESLQNRLQIRGVQQKYEQALKKKKTEWLISANAITMLKDVIFEETHDNSMNASAGTSGTNPSPQNGNVNQNGNPNGNENPNQGGGGNDGGNNTGGDSDE